MSELISGKDALIALANGREVENWNGSIWWDVEGTWQLDVFLKTALKFRLKPRTITINGIKVPEPADDRDYHYQGIWILNSLEPKEYGYVVLDITDEMPRYWWKSEEEIKQVVAALHQVFGGAK